METTSLLFRVCQETTCKKGHASIYFCMITERTHYRCFFSILQNSWNTAKLFLFSYNFSATAPFFLHLRVFLFFLHYIFFAPASSSPLYFASKIPSNISELPLLLLLSLPRSPRFFVSVFCVTSGAAFYYWAFLLLSVCVCSHARVSVCLSLFRGSFQIY